MIESEKKRIRSELRIVLIIIAMLVVVFFTCIGPNSLMGMFVSKVIFPGVYTSDIADYEDMRALMMDRYPWAPEFLPLEIPESAAIHIFEASDAETLQASPGLLLSMTLDLGDSEAELKRLQQLDPSGRFSNSTDFRFFDSDSQFAVASYQPQTRQFVYQISGD